jgi:hypothetical protein
MSQGSGHMGGEGPNRGRGRSAGKRPIYEDLDAPKSNDWLTLSDTGTCSGSGCTSSTPKRSKRAYANNKNPQWPLIEYTQFVRPVAMKYCVHRSMDSLERNYLNGGMDGYVELCKDLCRDFIKELDESEKFNNYLDYWEHVKWLDHIVTTNTNNVVKGTFEVLCRKNKD